MKWLCQRQTFYSFAFLSELKARNYWTDKHLVRQTNWLQCLLVSL